MVQKTVLVGRGLWVPVMGDLEAWPSITWSVLSGPYAVFSKPMAMGVILNPEQVKCTKWALMY